MVVAPIRHGVVVPPFDQQLDLQRKLLAFTPRSDLGRIVKAALGFLPTAMALDVLDAITRVAVVESSLVLTVLRQRESRFWGGAPIEDYGVVSRRLVTDAFVAAVVDALDVGVGFTLSNFRFHAIGTGSTAEAATETALGNQPPGRPTRRRRRTRTTPAAWSARLAR